MIDLAVRESKDWALLANALGPSDSDAQAALARLRQKIRPSVASNPQLLAQYRKLCASETKKRTQAERELKDIRKELDNMYLTMLDINSDLIEALQAQITLMKGEA